jgi:hypothetical protein
MATLTGNKPKDTYKGLIKTIDSNEVTGDVQLSDGNGNALPITVSATNARVNGESLSSYTHDQTTSSAEWNITHNMGKRPSVTIVDSTNRVVAGEVEYINENVLIVRFKAAFKGKAYLN